jgi:ACR3 family arsenite efflux pump ArsB
LKWFDEVFCRKFEGITEGGLLLTLVIIFSFQGRTILSNPLAILLIAIPLILQTYFIFFLGFGASKLMKVPYQIAAPSGMIGHPTSLSWLWPWPSACSACPQAPPWPRWSVCWWRFR